MDRCSKFTITLSVLALGLSAYSVFKAISADYELNELKRDAFIINVVNRIKENDKGLLTSLDLDIQKETWTKAVTADFNLLKDTGFGYVEYWVYFDSGLVLYIDTGKMIDEFYGAAIFEIAGMGPADGESNLDRQALNGPYYLIGNHRVYPK